MDQRLLECPVCMEKYKGRIFLCKTGHSLCESCRRVIRICPKCNDAMTDRRSYDLEALVKEIATKLKVSCNNAGCTQSLKGDQLNEHQLECKYRTHRCPLAMHTGQTCAWIGLYDKLMEHFKTKHANSARLTTNTKQLQVHITYEDFSDLQLLDYLDGKQLFYYRLKIDKVKERFFWLFQFIGTAKEAKNYSYEFEINKDLLKYKITGVCASDSDDFNQLVDAENCVALSFKQMKFYVDDENDVQIRFRIFNNVYMNKGKTNL